ncbi:hypothetical protein AB4Z10_06930 [Bosea sp. RAF48]|jgi:hypothetical protein|uniref:hypothetical protein n=1 Tax=Bosea sp. RAF48 TaxID=3237480 RepID=UPI003F8D9786
MLSRRSFLALAVSGPFWLLGYAGHAQAPETIDPAPPPVSMDEARRIAPENGFVRVEEAKLDKDA